MDAEELKGWVVMEVLSVKEVRADACDNKYGGSMCYDGTGGDSICDDYRDHCDSGSCVRCRINLDEGEPADDAAAGQKQISRSIGSEG